MTTNDIKSVQILIQGNNGDILVGNTSDNILIGMIASYVKFAEVDIKELLKGNKE